MPIAVDSGRSTSRPFRGDFGYARYAYIYAIEAQIPSKLIKIGQSLNPKKRLATLQGGCPVDLELLGALFLPEDCEKEIHQQLVDDHVRGEWFYPSSRVRFVVDCLVQNRAKDMFRELCLFKYFPSNDLERINFETAVGKHRKIESFYR